MCGIVQDTGLQLEPVALELAAVAMLPMLNYYRRTAEQG